METLTIVRRKGKRRETDTYRFAQQLPIRDGEKALKVNWCELMRVEPGRTGQQPISLRRVEQPAEQRRWRELVGRYHYLGYSTAYGASVRYWIETACDQPRTLGCLQFSSAAWRMKARDS